MNILIVVNYYDPYISGVSEYAKQVAEGLSRYHNVTVLTCKHIDNLSEVETINPSLRIIRAKPDFFLNKGYISVDFVRLFKKLQTDCDIVNFHFPMLEVGLLSKLTNKKIWLTYQCDMDLVGGFIDRLAVRAVQISGKVACSKADKIIVLSKDYVDNSVFLRKIDPTKVVEISPPNKYESELPLIEYSKKEKRKIGFVGRFVLEKGINHIIDAAEHFSDIEFMLAGDFKNVAGGTIFEELRGRIDQLSNVKVLGRLDDNELKVFYSEIDILLLPSTNRFEAFGMVQLEAMEFGCLVVASNLPGVRQVIHDTQNGFICDVASSESLISEISKTLDLRNKVGREDVKKQMRAKYSKQLFINSYNSLV